MMRSGIMIGWLALLVLPLAACPGGSQNGGAVFTSNAPPFSADSAWAYLQKQVGFGPRVPGSAGHSAQLAWMKEFLAARADTVILQEFTHTHTQTRQPVRLVNLFARFKPEAQQRILLLAHWDTRP